MRIVLESVKKEIENGRDCVLATIIAANGSSPRGKGAMMAVGADGLLAGSVGGGKVEGLALQQAANCLKNRASCAKKYVLRQSGEDAIGMACEGDVTLYFDYACPADLPRFQTMLEDLESYRPGSYAIETTEFGRIDIPYEYSDRALVYGGGHIAAALVPLLSRLNFSVWVLDDREAFSSPARFPDAAKTILCDYEKLSDYLSFRDEDYHIVVTDGHMHDFAVENQILRHDAVYYGAIGSRKKTKAVNAMLREAGISEEVIALVHAPIGLDIKAKTPAEIAVSIASELILERAKHREGLAFYERAGCPMKL